MAWALDKASIGTVIADNTFDANPEIFTTNQTVAVGAWIFLVAGNRGSAFTTVTGGGLVWTVVQAASGTPRGAIAYAYAAAGLASGTAITVNYAASNDARKIGGSSFTGGDANSFDTSVTNTGTAAGWSSGNIVTAQDAELLVTALYWDAETSNTITAPSVEDIDNSDATTAHTIVLAHRITTAAGTYTVAGTMGLGSSESWIAATVAMKVAAPGEVSLGFDRLPKKLMMGRP